ncbi:MAG: hypothetical protein Q9222_003926 [Ikaeria aurantiellina]
MADYLKPNETYIFSSTYFFSPALNIIGKIIIVVNAEFSQEEIPILHTAILTMTVRHLDNGLFGQDIVESRNGDNLGFLLVDRPLSGPDSLAEIFASGRLLAGVPTGLRSLVNPVPSSTKGCEATKCIAIIPVSTKVTTSSYDSLRFESLQMFSILAQRQQILAVSLVWLVYGGRQLLHGPRSPCMRELCKYFPTISRADLCRSPASLYIVYQPVQIFDMCGGGGSANGPARTFEINPTGLHTLEYRENAPPATKVLDLADLPCPPSHIADTIDPGAPYSPLIEALNQPFVFIESHPVELCLVGPVGDPPVYGVRVGDITGPNDGGIIPRV